MKCLLLALSLVFLCHPVSAQTIVYVPGHIKPDGTYVPGYHRTSPNSTKLDNWSTKGNVNPYTGKAGTVEPFRVDPYSTYSNPSQQRRNSTSLDPYQASPSSQKRNFANTDPNQLKPYPGYADLYQQKQGPSTYSNPYSTNPSQKKRTSTYSDPFKVVTPDPEND